MGSAESSPVKEEPLSSPTRPTSPLRGRSKKATKTENRRRRHSRGSVTSRARSTASSKQKVKKKDPEDEGSEHGRGRSNKKRSNTKSHEDVALSNDEAASSTEAIHPNDANGDSLENEATPELVPTETASKSKSSKKKKHRKKKERSKPESSTKKEPKDVHNTGEDQDILVKDEQASEVSKDASEKRKKRRNKKSINDNQDEPAERTQSEHKRLSGFQKELERANRRRKREQARRHKEGNKEDPPLPVIYHWGANRNDDESVVSDTSTIGSVGHYTSKRAGTKTNGVKGKAISNTEHDHSNTNVETQIESDATYVLANLRMEYCLDSPLSSRDRVMVAQGWSKALMSRSAFAEALAFKWRILVAKDELSSQHDDEGSIMGEANDYDPQLEEQRRGEIHCKAIDSVENCQDPIVECLRSRFDNVEELLMNMVDHAVSRARLNGCSPAQLRQNETRGKPLGHEPIRKFNLECQSLDDYFHAIALCGLLPRHWELFCEAFLWAMRTHVPRADKDDKEELDRPHRESAYARFVAGHLAVPAIDSAVQLRLDLRRDLFAVGVPRFWKRISQRDESKAVIGETFYRQLLTKYPELIEHFDKVDMDSIALDFVLALDLCVESIPEIGQGSTAFGKVLDRLGEYHLCLGIPSFSYALIGEQLLETLKPFFEQEEQLTKGTDCPVTGKDLETSFGKLYADVMSFAYFPMLRQEKLFAQAEAFYEQLAGELDWSPGYLSSRLHEVMYEIAMTGTYAHTSEELKAGAKIAWRNSAKRVCVDAWENVIVRDCRHVKTPYEMLKEVERHLGLTRKGKSAQAVMTVFEPRNQKAWGVRFWSSQLVRYACYEDEKTGELMGDPRNRELTAYLLRQKLWTPPEPQTDFDVLPIVLKIPGEITPFAFQLPKEAMHEVHIEHPKNPEIARLGLRWSATPTVSNVKMSLGGVDYQCAPFSSWYSSSDVSNNLWERYQIGHKFARSMGIDTSEDLWEQKTSLQIESAVLSSYRNKLYKIVDPASCERSFRHHIVREREIFGRDSIATWRCTGPNHDHTVSVQSDSASAPRFSCRDANVFENCSDSLLLVDDQGNGTTARSQTDFEKNSLVKCEKHLPRVLIAFGSETGNSEAVAWRLAKSLRRVRPILQCLNDVSGLGIVAKEGITHLFVVCSTYEKGEPPRNATRFFDSAIPAGTLSGINVAVLALGSTLYPDFCKAGVQLEQKLTDAGCNRFIALGKVDLATGSNGLIDDWVALIQRLVVPQNIKSVLTERNGSFSEASTDHRIKWLRDDKPSSSEGGFQLTENEPCVCIANEELMSESAASLISTRRLVFDLPEGVTYETGDLLCIEPVNDLQEVKRFARCFWEELRSAAISSANCPCEADEGSIDSMLLWQLKQPISIEYTEKGTVLSPNFVSPTTLWDTLETGVDFLLRESVIFDIVSLLTTAVERAKSDDEDTIGNNVLYIRYCDLTEKIVSGYGNEKRKAAKTLMKEYSSVVDFLEEFSELFLTCSENIATPIVSLVDVLSVLPKMQRRFYSVSSSSIAHPQTVAITVKVLKGPRSQSGLFRGLCSGYLSAVRPNEDRVRISISKTNFRIPEELTAPVVMIVQDTGVSAVMGFLQQRAMALQKGNGDEKAECHLFYSCRPDVDPLYRELVEQYHTEGVCQVHWVLSSSANDLTGFQDCLKRKTRIICDLLLRQDAHFFVCCDATMSNEIREACVNVLHKHNFMCRVAAAQHLKRMRRQGRWQSSLWGDASQFREQQDMSAHMNSSSTATWLSRLHA